MALPILRVTVRNTATDPTMPFPVRVTFRSVNMIGHTFDVECYGGDAHEGIDTTPVERLLASMTHVGDDTIAVDRRGTIARMVSMFDHGAVGACEWGIVGGGDLPSLMLVVERIA